MTTAQLRRELLEQLEFLERLTPDGEAWSVAFGYMAELLAEYRRRMGH